MPKYLFIGQYTAEGARGVMKDGGSRRREVAAQLTESVGGTLEAFYFAFGPDDFFVLVDLPDNAAAVAASMNVAAAGAVNLRTVVLLTPEEMDRATQQQAQYTPPGG
ncbi:MAG: GYD domain-containing protein [Chloroflexota bacterium]|nr:GYD domain-containing protein [Chloroflexota bacterium]